MKKVSFLAVIIVCLSFVQCAKQGTPTGGDIDSIPPKFIRASPENFTTNFDAEEIEILFNEFVKLEKPTEQIIISPPMDPKPNITPLGLASKDIKIEITDTLQENTTYVINFGRSIVDHNGTGILEKTFFRNLVQKMNPQPKMVAAIPNNTAYTKSKTVVSSYEGKSHIGPNPK